MSGDSRIRQYKHVLFDLDHTLWDFDSNAKEALGIIYRELGLEEMGIASFNEFYKRYRRINGKYWAKYNRGNVTKAELRVGRFYDALARYGIENEALSETISKRYIEESPYQTYLVHGTKELLEYLTPGYNLSIVTNGFKEVQHIKLENCGIAHFFQSVFISEEIGHHKPSESFFHHVLEALETRVEDCILVGDNLLTDIEGARRMGMDHIYYNPSRNIHRNDVTHEISQLLQILEIL